MADKTLDDHDGEFYKTYGRAMAAWVELERSLGSILVVVGGLTPEVAGAVYYSANSFRSRAAMLRACVPFAKTIPAGRDFLTGIINRAVAYSDTRNTLAHERHMMNLFDTRLTEEEDPDFVFQISIGTNAQRLSHKGIRNAALNFFYLNQVIVVCLGQAKPVREPELALALLDLMPRDPVARVADLKKASLLSAEIERSPR
ncbi:MAG: hypothetical protein EPN98_03585 [Phenylobacterium sp.]|uniref:hypothetical protein n=1 Tax=Phenylobacterium sp. TaxID=1871053 RepID=UPI001216AEF8|nr:hypothetical protein [Phenylobacterium sp.]TAL37378.1 MAG: hypothetical protein EPN98_03585 [Phenylobacterium sp.]